MPNYLIFIFAAFCYSIANSFKDCHNQHFSFLQLLQILQIFHTSLYVLERMTDLSFHLPIPSETKWTQ